MRYIAAGPSGAGKGYVFANIILKHFRGCWARIYIFSPTAVLDKTWDPVRKYIQEEMGVDLKKEPAFFEEWGDGAITAVKAPIRHLDPLWRNHLCTPLGIMSV